MENPTPMPIQALRALHRFKALLAPPGAQQALPPAPEAFAEVIADLAAEHSLELAWLILRQTRPDPALWGGFQARLKAELERVRNRRMAQWQTDPDRTTLRLRFAVRAPLSSQNPVALLGILARTLMEAGLRVAVGPDKGLRPALHLGQALPPLVEGLSEWADAELLEPAPVALAELPALVSARAPLGLTLLEFLQVPNYASRVAELCRAAHWRWNCPEACLEDARARLAGFLASDRFEIDKAGKVDGQKGSRRVDIRPWLADCRWSGAELHFSTRIAAGAAANPRKLLAAVLGLEIQDLVRTALELEEDPRLLQADKFQPKLHNMFEDAVALGAQDRIRIVEEDDDDPIRLG